uniref:Odontogenic ameloblast-associated protein n=1 Tax=Mustela putorius furo TaxID=9669 RepID=M3YEB1_MUSPF
MKTVILLGLLGATMSAPIIPQRLMSASNSNELLLSLNNAQLQPLQLQVPWSTEIPFKSAILSQPQIKSVKNISEKRKTALEFYIKKSSTSITFLCLFWQVLPYMLSFKMPQEQAQMLQYYPVYMLLPWEQSQQTATQSPPQMGQQQFEEQMPFYTQFGYIPVQAEPVMPGGQQQLALDPLQGTAPDTAVMPAEGVIPYLQKEGRDFKHASGGIFIPATSQKPSTTNSFAPTVDPTITPELMEKKAKTDSLKEP